MGILDAAYRRDTKSARNSAYYDLAQAIVLAAVEDYRRLRKSLAKASDYERPTIRRNLFSIERFFKSEYGDVICLGQAKIILEGLQNEGGRKC